jgi:hypothetical protein
MTPVWWMVGASVASWAAVAAVAATGRLEVLFGMLAPLAAAVVTWVLVSRTYRARPERLTPLMIKAFGVKMVFYGAYVTLMLTTMGLRPVPFAISFTVYFIALHLIEAMFLQRLFAGTPNAD